MLQCGSKFCEKHPKNGRRVTCAFLARCEKVEGALAVEQPHACRLKPGLEALSNRAMQQRGLAAAWAVGCGLWAVGFGSLGRLGWPYLPRGVQPGMLVATHGRVKMLRVG